MGILTVEEYNLFEGVASPNTAPGSTRKQAYIAATQAKMEKYCGRKFDYQLYTEKYDGQNSPELLLKNYPVKSIESISWVLPDDSVFEYDSASYTFDEESGRVYLWAGSQVRWDWGLDTECGFPKGALNIQVEYYAGYKDDWGDSHEAEDIDNFLVPHDLKLLCYELTKDAIQSGGSNSDFQSESFGKYSYNRRPLTDSFALYANRLAPYRKQGR